MNLQQLQCFKVVAEFQHMTKASNHLHIAQPALSKTVKVLEDELKARLFDRVGKNIYINDNGRILLKYVCAMEKELQQMEAEVTGVQRQSDQVVTILMKATPLLVVPLLQSFREKHPEITVKLLTYNHHINETGVEFDFWLEDSVLAKAKPECIALCREEVILAVGADHPWAGREVELSAAADMDFVSIPTSQMKGKEFLQLCKRQGFQPKIILESSDLYTLQEMVKSGAAIALVPEYSWGFLNNERIRCAYIREPKLWNTIYVGRVRKSGSSKAADYFWSYLIEQSKQEQSAKGLFVKLKALRP